MKTIWKTKVPKKYVTRDELPGLVRHTLAELILGRSIPDDQAPDTVVAGVPVGPELARGLAAARRLAPPERKPIVIRAKLPRAKGHIHKGRCGKRCFSGERPPL